MSLRLLVKELFGCFRTMTTSDFVPFSQFLFQLKSGQWISPSAPLMPQIVGSMAVGNYKTITLIGGDNFGYDVIEYNITNNSFSYYPNKITGSSDIFSTGLDSNGRRNVFPFSSQINRYDLITKGVHFELENVTIPVNIQHFAVLHH